MNDDDDIVSAVSSVASAISTGLKYLGTGDAGTTMGAIEFHAVNTKEAAEAIQDALKAIAESISDLAHAVRQTSGCAR